MEPEADRGDAPAEPPAGVEPAAGHLPRRVLLSRPVLPLVGGAPRGARSWGCGTITTWGARARAASRRARANSAAPGDGYGLPRRDTDPDCPGVPALEAGDPACPGAPALEAAWFAYCQVPLGRRITRCPVVVVACESARTSRALQASTTAQTMLAPARAISPNRIPPLVRCNPVAGGFRREWGGG